METTMEILSERLRSKIRTYCHEMDDLALEDLGKVVRSGSAAWFPDEFADAIRAGAFTPLSWERLVNVAMDDDEHELLDEYLRLVWSSAAPGRTYPLGRLSERLMKKIRVHCHAMDNPGMDELGKAVRSGSAVWFPEEFANAILNGEFTPLLWEELADVSVEDEETLDEYLRLVWSRTAPGWPYPLDPGGREALAPKVTPRLDKRLRDAILEYCHHMVSEGLKDLQSDVARGSMGWFPDAFEAAINAGVFTPERWASLTRTGLKDDKFDQLDKNLRRVWSHVAPGRPFPPIANLPGQQPAAPRPSVPKKPVQRRM